MQNFSLTKMHLKILCAKWRPFCSGEDELNYKMILYDAQKLSNISCPIGQDIRYFCNFQMMLFCCLSWPSVDVTTLRWQSLSLVTRQPAWPFSVSWSPGICNYMLHLTADSAITPLFPDEIWQLKLYSSCHLCIFNHLYESCLHQDLLHYPCHVITFIWNGLHIEVRTKWLHFCIQHFQMYFYQLKLLCQIPHNTALAQNKVWK